MAESTNDRKRQKKSKKYYGGSKKMKLEDKLCVGMRGILVFGAMNEAKARREAYNLLNEYADELFGSEFLDNILHRDSNKKLIVDYQHGLDPITIDHEEPDHSRCENEKEEKEEDEDIEKTIAKEIAEIKNAQKDRRFHGVSTGVTGILFIKSSLSNDSLHELVHHILTDLEATKQKKNRSFQRLIPVTEICHANLAAIRKTVSETFLPGFDEESSPVQFCIHYKCRFHDKLTRSEVLSEVSGVFLSAGHTVNLKYPDKVIIIEIMKSLCCMSVVKDFFRFKKYNVHEITNNPKDNPPKASKPKELEDGDDEEQDENSRSCEDF